MTTRLYLAATGAAALSPAFGAMWEQSTSAIRRPMAAAPSGSAMAEVVTTRNAAGTIIDQLAGQFISTATLPEARTISGDVSVVVRARESSTTADAFLQLRVFIVKPDGTERAEVFAGQVQTAVSAVAGANNEELFNTGSAALAQTRILTTLALTPQLALTGDRIGVELGTRTLAGSTSVQTAVRFGDPVAGADLALSAGVATDDRPWVQFSMDIFAPPDPPPPPPWPPTAELDYTVELGLGAVTWTVGRGDPADFGPVDGLSIGWAYPEGSGLFPPQPEPVTAAFGIVAEDSTTLAADLRIGAPVTITLTMANMTAEFYGRVAEATAQPIDLTIAGVPVQAILYSVSAVGYDADPAELVVGSAPWPAEDTLARLDHIMTAAGYAVMLDHPPGAIAVPVAARDIDARSVSELLAHYTTQYPLRSTLDPEAHRAVIAGQIDGTTPVQLVEIPDHITAGRYPAKLSVSGTLSFTANALTGADAPMVLDAHWLDFDAKWTASKAANPNAIVVIGDVVGTVTTTAGLTPVVTEQLNGVDLTDPADAALVGAMYLPDATEQATWTVDTFRLMAYLDVVDLGEPDATLILSPTRVADVLTNVVVIDNIPGTQNPVPQYLTGGDSYYAGMLISAQLVIRDKRVTVDFKLRPDIPPPPAAGDGFAMSWANAATNLPALTWALIDSSITWADARLIRKA